MSLFPEEAKFLNLEYLFSRILNWSAHLFILLKKNGLSFLKKLEEVYFFIFIGILVITIGVIWYKMTNETRRKKFKSKVRFKDEDILPQNRSDKWKQIDKKIESDNVEEWEEAIVLAGGIFDEIFSRLGFHGENLSEKLKHIEPSDFESLREVWEASEIQNKIIKDTTAFSITKEKAKEVLEKYKKGLKELGYI